MFSSTENTVNAKSEEKQRTAVIFYHLWHPTFTQGTKAADSSFPRNLTRIFEENSDAASSAKNFGPVAGYQFWGEPLFGYYDLSVDKYVVRKHAQMLTDAHIDSIMIDYTNFFAGGSYSDSGYTKKALKNLIDTYLEIRAEGGKTPTISFILTWNAQYSAKALDYFYKDFYSKEQYSELWMQWEGKPLILCEGTYVDPTYSDLFTYRKPHPFYTPTTEPNAWPWLSIYPQSPAYTETNTNELVAVSVAQNWSTSLDFMSARDDNGNYICRGRSFSVGGDNKLLSDPTSPEYKSYECVNFKQQFDKALELDPDAIFITGWNEWIAGRIDPLPSWAASYQKTSSFGGFCDVFTSEFSRDIEPTRDGGLGDSFYLTLCDYVKKYKKINDEVPVIDSIENDTDTFPDFSKCANLFTDDNNDTYTRDYTGLPKKTTYTQTTGRNNFVSSKICSDADNIYFLVETKDNISEPANDSWMQLFITVDKNEPNWEGYQFTLNRKDVKSADTALLEKSNGGDDWTTVSDSIVTKLDGNKYQVCIPKAQLGISNNKYSISFKWVDNIISGDALSFYTDGDCMPNGRSCFTVDSAEISKNKSNNGSLSFSKTLLACLSVIAVGLIAVAVTMVIKTKKK